MSLNQAQPGPDSLGLPASVRLHRPSCTFHLDHGPAGLFHHGRPEEGVGRPGEGRSSTAVTSLTELAGLFDEGPARHPFLLPVPPFLRPRCSCCDNTRCRPCEPLPVIGAGPAGVLFYFDHDPAVVSFFTMTALKRRSLLHRSQQPDPAGRAVRGLCRRLSSGDLDGAAAAASGLA